jgi:ribosome maturation factor RimP
VDLSKVQDFIQLVLDEEGYELYSLSFKKEKSDYILEVIVDKDEPIDMNMIVSLSEKISLKLDEVDLIEQEYLLNVMSLGAEKPIRLEKISKYVGSFIHLHLIHPINGENIYEGEIISVNDNKLVLAYRVKTRTKQIEVDFTNIYKVRLAIKF